MAIAKPAGTWRYVNLFDLPDDGTRYEIVEGELFEMPSPAPRHQFIIANLMALLTQAVWALGGRIASAPLDVFFPGADPVQPDLLVLLGERLAMVSERGIEGAPNLVVEVLSPSNLRHDLVRKRQLYALGAVAEYWIVDPDAQTVEVLVLDGTSYRSRLVARGDDPVTSTILPDVAFPAAAVFAGIPE